MRRVTRCLVARFDGLAISSMHTVCGYNMCIIRTSFVHFDEAEIAKLVSR